MVSYPFIRLSYLFLKIIYFLLFSFILGGEQDTFHIPMTKFKDLEGYSSEWDAGFLKLDVDPASFLFLPNQPHGAWSRLSDLVITLPPDADQFNLQAVLVRLAFQRKAHLDYVLNVEAVMEYPTFDLPAANKHNWALSTQIKPVVLFAKDVHIMKHDAAAFELLPLVLRSEQGGSAVSDSSLRFLAFQALTDASSVSHHSSLGEWLQWSQTAKRRTKPPSAYGSTPFTVPITQFTMMHGQREAQVCLNGIYYHILLGDLPVVSRMAPSSSAAATSAPPVSQPPPTPALPGASGSAPPVSTTTETSRVPLALPSSAAPVAALSTTPAVTFGAPAPRTSATAGNYRLFTRQPAKQSAKHKALKLPTPTAKQKFSANPTMMAVLPPTMPTSVKAAVSAAVAAKSQSRVLAARKLFVTLLDGRDPFDHPQPHDAVYILDGLFKKKLAPATVEQYMSNYFKWAQLVNVKVPNKPLLRMALKGYKNLALLPIKNATKKFSLPFTFQALKCLATGLRSLSIAPVLKAAVWSCALTLFWALLRTGEVLPTAKSTYDITSQLCLDDCCLNEDGTVSLWLKLPKVQTIRGDIVELIPLDTLVDFCPVRALLNYLPYRAEITTSPSYPLYLVSAGVPLTKNSFAATWKRALSACGVDNFTIDCHRNHSFRASLPSLLQTANISPDLLKHIGRWSSSAYLTYLRDVKARSDARKQAVSLCAGLATEYL